MITKPNTTAVVTKVSCRVGQTTLRSSMRDSSTNCHTVLPRAELPNTAIASTTPTATAAQRCQSGARCQHIERRRCRAITSTIATTSFAVSAPPPTTSVCGAASFIDLIAHPLLATRSPAPRAGRPGGNRTPNLRFWRPPLCQLSYWPVNATSKSSTPRRRRRCVRPRGSQSAAPAPSRSGRSAPRSS